MTNEEKRERNEKLTRALAGLARGQHPDGTPIDFAMIAARSWEATRRFAEKLRIGQARTRQRIHASGIRFRG